MTLDHDTRTASTPRVPEQRSAEEPQVALPEEFASLLETDDPEQPPTLPPLPAWSTRHYAGEFLG
jgi:hypothetical protein